jgi:hypothetical protein
MLVTPGDVTTMTFDWGSPDYRLHDVGTVPAWGQA